MQLVGPIVVPIARKQPGSGRVTQEQSVSATVAGGRRARHTPREASARRTIRGVGERESGWEGEERRGRTPAASATCAEAMRTRTTTRAASHTRHRTFSAFLLQVYIYKTAAAPAV